VEVTHTLPITFANIFNIITGFYHNTGDLNTLYVTPKSETNSTVTYTYDTAKCVIVIGTIADT
jgi:hypothetical protein